MDAGPKALIASDFRGLLLPSVVMCVLRKSVEDMLPRRSWQPYQKKGGEGIVTTYPLHHGNNLVGNHQWLALAKRITHLQGHGPVFNNSNFSIVAL